MPRWWPLPLAFVVVIGTGIAHGLCSDRWSAGRHVQDAADILAQFPRTVDDWEGTDIQDDVLDKFRNEIPGFLQRRYVQRGTRQEVMVAMVCGRPGPISVHTPEVCYTGAGYRMTSERTRQQIAGSGSEPAPFWKATFVKETFPNREELRVWWSWHAGSSWQVVTEPRMAFARYPVLHKLYVIYRVPPGNNAPADPCPAFLRRLIPEVNAQLFSGS